MIFASKIKLLNIILLSSLFLYATATATATAKDDPDKKNSIPTQKLTVEADNLDEADNSMKSYLIENFALLPEKLVNKLITKRTIEAITSSDSGNVKKTLYYKVSYEIPENFLVDTAKILWVLNIPEFRSHLYQLYKSDTVYIDTWNNVIGMSKSDTKTSTGYFEAYRIRNWPSYKDPEKGKEDEPPVPPGPKNPLGLFVVHFDENSMQYFHGTNKEYLLSSKMRNLSHGCVRNYNGNIAKMKEFIIHRVIKADDLNYWLDSKRTLSYEVEKQDRFPITIMYKTFCLDTDEKGSYVELYKDIYNYSSKGNINDRHNDHSLIILTTKENLTKEYRTKFGNDISDADLDVLTNRIMKTCDEYERYYLSDLK
jgi:lipoprotein-anchoring transpeptidase ErfK/SrfK